MYKGEVIKAVNDNIEPILLTYEEVLATRVKNFEKTDLNVAMMHYETELEAERLLPIWKSELVVREVKLDKKYQMWTNEQYKEFEQYFADKYINNRKRKGVM